jgi:formate/nitrite transporter FocA (FNT family)
VADDETRPKAGDIYERVAEGAREELERTNGALGFSGLFAGLTIGLSALGVASALSLLGHAGWAQFVSALLYPVGFLAVILGRAQLFTENTLYPVVLVLEDRRHVAPTRPNFWSGVVAGWIIALIAWLVEAGVGHLLAWLAAVTAGNIIGGVLIVAVLNVGQVRSH